MVLLAAVGSRNVGVDDISATPAMAHRSVWATVVHVGTAKRHRELHVVSPLRLCLGAWVADSPAQVALKRRGDQFGAIRTMDRVPLTAVPFVRASSGFLEFAHFWRNPKFRLFAELDLQTLRTPEAES